jgi:elongation factor Ts
MSTPIISASLVKTLRERTNAGMMECKRALEENSGDIEKAIEAMRKSGQAKADKKVGRITAEGIILALISTDQKHGIILEINCETDFVARDTNFLSFAKSIAEKTLSSKENTIEGILNLRLESGESVDEARRSLVSKIGENIQIRRFIRKDSSHTLTSYVHGGRIGALVEIEGGDANLAKDIAMHIVASNPLVINPTEVSQEIIANEKEIFSAQALSSGKPANIIEKMIEGRIKKFLDEISLMGQPFVKNPDETVGKLLENNKAKVYSFVRFAVGEGVEKKTENFAEEVMAQVRGS